jgi:hypothetical protein
MEPQKDFEEFFELLNLNKVQYLLVGGYAYAIYAEPRYTKDIDIFHSNDRKNVGKILNVLDQFGFGNLDIGKEDFEKKGQVIQLGMPPYRIDLLNKIEAVAFEEAWQNRNTARYGEQEIFVISKNDLINNKKATGRNQDKLDVENLKKTN